MSVNSQIHSLVAPLHIHKKISKSKVTHHAHWRTIKWGSITGKLASSSARPLIFCLPMNSGQVLVMSSSEILLYNILWYKEGWELWGWLSLYCSQESRRGEWVRSYLRHGSPAHLPKAKYLPKAASTAKHQWHLVLLNKSTTLFCNLILRHFDYTVKIPGTFPRVDWDNW